MPGKVEKLVGGSVVDCGLRGIGGGRGCYK